MESLGTVFTATLTFYLFWLGYILFLCYFKVVFKCICFYLLLRCCYFLWRCYSSSEGRNHNTIQWFWQNDNGSYTPYPEDISQILTQAYLRDPHSCTMIHVNNNTYKVDFDSMTQTNDATGFERLITKCVEEPESTVSFPPSWEQQTTTLEVFSVQRGTPEWKHVERKFKATIDSLSIKLIDRIQNTLLWERHVQEMNRMGKKNSGAVNEMELFHGTRGTAPREIYDSEEGFDMCFSAQGMWGQANYFAVNASYSDCYAHTNTIGEKEIFLASVLTGDSYRCDKDSSLRMPPLKSSTGGVQLQRVRYDTVTGYTGGSRVYMTYDNHKAYPTYLITYSENQDSSEDQKSSCKIM